MTVLVNRLEHVPAVIVGVYCAGNCPLPGEPADGDRAQTVAVTLESTADGKVKTKHVVDSLPLQYGSPIHRLACATSGFSLSPADVQADLRALLGKPLMVYFEGNFLRHVQSFPARPKHSPSLMAPGAIGGCAGVIQRPDRTVYPTPPQPSITPRFWRVTDLTTATVVDLPATVADLVRSSEEFAKLSPKIAPKRAVAA